MEFQHFTNMSMISDVHSQASVMNMDGVILNGMRASHTPKQAVEVYHGALSEEEARRWERVYDRILARAQH